MTIRSSLLAATAAAMLVAGCGGAKNESANAAPANGAVVAQGGGATVTKDANGSTTVTTNDGSATVKTGAPSGDLPGGLPAYPNAQAGGGMDVSGTQSGMSGRVVSFTTTDQPKQVLDFYANAAGQAGMQTTARTDMGGTAALTLTKGNESIAVTATAMGGTTQVQVASGTR